MSKLVVIDDCRMGLTYSDMVLWGFCGFLRGLGTRIASVSSSPHATVDLGHLHDAIRSGTNLSTIFLLAPQLASSNSRNHYFLALLNLIFRDNWETSVAE